jgi:hypothetical protein
MEHPQPWLKYVDAGDLDNDAIDFDGMNVESPTGEHLGDVDGFIVDSDSGRPYYVVVDAGGWFKTRHFLLPIGHAELDAAEDGEALVVDLNRERIDKFPGFDIDEFDRLTATDMTRMNNAICTVCSVEGGGFTPSESYSAAWERADFRQPDWWTANPARPDRMGASSVTAGVETARSQREHTTSTERATAQDRRPGDESPHFDGRAQPGDVIGVETSERTYLGDTREDEDKRREDVQKAAEDEKPGRRR